MTCSTSKTGQIVPLLLTLIGSLSLHHPTALGADDDGRIHFRCEATDESHDDNAILRGIRWSSASPGDLIAPAALSNRGSWQFDGLRGIAYAVPSDAPGFAENFTWEGFFLSPSSNTFLSETGIADRLLTQFAFDKGDWTRLAIGLVADRQGLPRLCVELEGFEGRTFGMGDCTISADRWHHFALVHEGTAAAATIRWYLDYELTGELFLGGQSNQKFGRPPDFDGQGGRGHQSEAFSAALFGGGLKTGQVIGVTDELGRKVSEYPISVPDFHATILAALGIDPATELFDDDRPIPITDHGTSIEKLFV